MVAVLVSMISTWLSSAFSHPLASWLSSCDQSVPVLPVDDDAIPISN